ncbi:MAG: hypothetical protein AAFV71_32275 [Cyanobacteria bacterium J06633_8]
MMKFKSFNTTKNLLLALVGFCCTFTIATPSTLAQTTTVQINPEVLRDTPIIRRDIRIINQYRKICGYRSERQCKEWLKKLRQVQPIKIPPQPQPDPFPIRVAPNRIKTQ